MEDDKKQAPGDRRGYHDEALKACEGQSDDKKNHPFVKSGFSYGNVLLRISTVNITN